MTKIPYMEYHSLTIYVKIIPPRGIRNGPSRAQVAHAR